MSSDDSTRLGVGGVVEEVYELLLSPFQKDEYRRSMLKLQARQTELLEADQEGFSTGPPLVGDDPGDSIEAGAVGRRPAPATEYEQTETQGSVSIQPGAQKTIVEFAPKEAVLWFETGITDNPDTTYQYYARGEPMFDSPLAAPLGLPNSPHEFPVPLISKGTIRADGIKDAAAPGSSEYVGTLRHFPISTTTANDLLQSYSSL